MSVAICILAKDEEKSIEKILKRIAQQSIVSDATVSLEIHVVANGCSDETVEIARGCKPLFASSHIKFHVHDLQPGGKSRAWNRTVHDLADNATEYFVFVDADIKFANDGVIAELLTLLKADRHLAACTGFPVKDADLKPSKTILDRFSLIVSKHTRHVGAINGSLYVGRAAALRTIWLPNQTPGEDGFVNAMLSTNGFTIPDQPALIAAPDRPTHSFQAHGPMQFVAHERRMIVGTMINRWIFEYLWSLKLDAPAGLLIRGWNENDPDWVDRLVGQRSKEAKWLIPSAILFSRFRGRSGRPWWKQAVYLPIATVATLVTLRPAILANKRLKELGAAASW